jgi:hypothetical protein
VGDGFRIRKLPDGSSEFVLDEPTLTFLRIDHRSKLQFGEAEVAIGTPFSIEADGVIHRLDPQRWDALGPLVAMFPGTLRWLWTSPDGELTAVFRDGSTLTVSPDPVSRAWSVGNVSCLPTGPDPPAGAHRPVSPAPAPPDPRR